MTQLTEKSTQVRKNLLDGIKDHPIPAAVASLGLGMLIVGSVWKKGNGRARIEEKLESGREAIESAKESSREMKSDFVEKAKEWTGKAQDYARQFSSGKSEGVSGLSDNISERIRGAGSSLSGLIEGNPLAAIAVALAFGAALGFGLPEMRREKEDLGEAVPL